MKKRVKQPAITRRTILQAAGAGFAAEGYAATGIGDIASTSGLTRGALFHHFADKRGLAVAWIEEELVPALEEACVSRFDQVAGFPEWKSAWLGLMGDLSPAHPVTLLNRLGSEWVADPVLRELMRGLADDWSQAVAARLAQGQGAGWIHRAIRPDDESLVLVSQLCGVSLLVRLADDPAGALARCQRSFGSYLETFKVE